MALILDTNENYYISSSLDMNKVLTISSNKRNLIIDERSEMLNQQWIFRYSLIKDSYLMSSNLSDVFISWISPYSNDVIAYPYVQSDGQHWLLKSVGMRKIIIQNYSNPDMILDLTKDPSLNNDKLIVSSIKDNDDDETFKLILLD